MESESLRIASATGVDVALPIAGAGSRSYAFLVDWHLRVLFALAWLIIAAFIVAGSPMKLNTITGGGRVLVMLPAALLYLLYHPVLEITMRGRTPGKRLAGVRLVTRDGGTPSAGALLVRNVFRFFDGLPAFYMVGLIATLVTRDSVRIGDMAAGTLLVHDETASVDALDALAGIARDTRHDPALIDLAQDLLRRWEELEPARRDALATSMLVRLGVPQAQGMIQPSLRAQLQAALTDTATPR